MARSPIRWLSQTAAITWVSIRTIPQRLGASLAATVGVAGVVAVMVAVLAMAAGFRATLETSGSPDTALVMRSGSETEMNSILAQEETRIIADAPGVLRNEQGPVASAELFVIVDVPKRSTGTVANVPLRGVQPAAFDVRGEVRIVEGRNFEPGRNELIAGTGAAAQFAGLDVGSKLRLGELEWTVVGLFSAEGTVAESELWCDARVLQPAYRRGSSYQSVYAKLESPEAYDRFKDALTADPRVDVSVIRETDYYARQSRTIYQIITYLGALVAGLMGIAAVFGAINTMYSAVAARTREIATLRALGFRGGSVVVSVLVESLLLAVAGGAIGAVGAYVVFNGYQTTTLNWESFSQVTFAFAVTPALMVDGILYATLIGLLGGLAPAIRAARVQVASALREL
jgi:putative ABC transport system permease protein